MGFVDFVKNTAVSGFAFTLSFAVSAAATVFVLGKVDGAGKDSSAGEGDVAAAQAALAALSGGVGAAADSSSGADGEIGGGGGGGAGGADASEEDFGAASTYVRKQGKYDQAQQLRFYGLFKLATAGPCEDARRTLPWRRQRWPRR